MGTGNIRYTAGALDDAAAKVEQMPFCAERQASDFERTGRCTRSIDLLIRAGIREAVSILNLEGEWLKRRRRPSA